MRSLSARQPRPCLSSPSPSLRSVAFFRIFAGSPGIAVPGSGAVSRVVFLFSHFLLTWSIYPLPAYLSSIFPFIFLFFCKKLA